MYIKFTNHKNELGPKEKGVLFPFPSLNFDSVLLQIANLIAVLNFHAGYATEYRVFYLRNIKHFPC